MDKRPIVEIKPTKTDNFIEAIAYLALIVLWIMTIVSFNSLPDSIPIHYNGIGEVDNYGRKTSIFLLPIFGSFLFMLLTVLNKNPENFNYNIKITEDNAEKQYTNAIKMMRFLKLIVIIIFIMIDFQTIQTAKGKSDGIGIWFLPLVFGLIFIPIGYFAYQSYKQKS
jgi:uncharacterized membrane protein